MPKYTGSQCMVCQNLFRPDDDIVVCPDCGTPYHRSCYAAKGACINLPLHESGKSWQEQLHQEREKNGGTKCPNCHYMNRPGAQLCEACHAPLETADPQTPHINVMMADGSTLRIDPNDPCCGMDPEEQLEGEQLQDIASFVGTNTLYYIPLFKRFKDTGKKLSVNLPCLLFPHLYFANRKMWLMTLLTIAVLVLCSIPSMLVGMQMFLSSEEAVELYGKETLELFAGVLAFAEANESLLQALDVIFYGVQLTFRVLMCVFANWIYFRHALRAVRKLRNSGATPQVKRMLLRSDGGTNFLNTLGAIGIYYLAAVVLMTALTLVFFYVA